MKRILITLFILFIASHYFYSINAQNKDDKKKEKKIVIKIDKEEDGKITKIDTTIILKEGENPDKILEKYGIKSDKSIEHTKTYKVKIDSDDTSKMSKKEKMVWVTVDDDNDTIKHKSDSKQMIFITDDGDGDGHVVHMENGNVMIFKEKDGNELYHIKEFNKELMGDSMIWEEKVIVGNHPDMKQKKVYKFKHQNMDSEDNVFLFSDGNHREMNHMMMREIDDDSDSTIIVIKKYKDGKEITDTKKVLRKEKKENKVMIRVTDPDKTDLSILKLKENFKKLEVKDFNIMVKNTKMLLNFELAEKSNTSLKLIDKDGKTVFNEDLKQFSGKYSKETDAIKGEFYIQINQGSKFFIRKVIMDFN